MAVRYGLVPLKLKCLITTTHTMVLSSLKILIWFTPSKAMKLVTFTLDGIMLTTPKLAMLAANHPTHSRFPLLKKYTFRVIFMTLECTQPIANIRILQDLSACT